MALWEYKVITSGQHGFASPALLETHLNTLGKDEWEIIHFQTQPTNPLAFTGLARRSTMRDWIPPVEVAASSPPRSAPEPVAQKTTLPNAKPEPESPVSRAEEKTDAVPPSREETLRTMRNTERDLDPDAEEEDEDWDTWEEDQDDLPTLFEAMKPHLRRNQKGPGMSVALDYLAKRWEQREADLLGAFKECGFTVPETEEADPEYFEFEGDLYWVNRNNRGQLFINTREKPRPVFRIAQAKKLEANDPATADLAAERAAERTEIDKRKAEKTERAERQAAQEAAKAAATAAKAAALAARESGPAISDQDGPSTPAEKDEPESKEPGAPLPSGEELLDKIRPLMRRNRRGPGYSGSVGFLARALRNPEADLVAALAAIGLNVPVNAADKPVYVEVGPGVYWMNRDNRGGVWINGREKREGGAKNQGANQESRENDETAGATEGVAGASSPPVESDNLAVATAATSTLPSDAHLPDSPAGETAAGATKPYRDTASEKELLDKGTPESELSKDGFDTAANDKPSPETASSKDEAREKGTPPTEGETAKAGKAGKPARRPSSRPPRPRKIKSDTEQGAPRDSGNPPVQETDTKKKDDSSTE